MQISQSVRFALYSTVLYSPTSWTPEVALHWNIKME